MFIIVIAINPVEILNYKNILLFCLLPLEHWNMKILILFIVIFFWKQEI